jgi:AcrR family transcriptional regulator
VEDRDRETRERLLESATRLFAERGFAKVTVREIC